MIRAEFGVDWDTIRQLYLALVLFGIGYNTAVAWADKKGYLAGYMSLAVAIGVAITVGSMVFISPIFTLITIGAFFASGIPMILGSIYRHVRARDEMLQKMRDEARNEHPGETLAP